MRSTFGRYCNFRGCSFQCIKMSCYPYHAACLTFLPGSYSWKRLRVMIHIPGCMKHRRILKQDLHSGPCKATRRFTEKRVSFRYATIDHPYLPRERRPRSLWLDHQYCQPQKPAKLVEHRSRSRYPAASPAAPPLSFTCMQVFQLRHIEHRPHARTHITNTSHPGNASNTAP